MIQSAISPMHKKELAVKLKAHGVELHGEKGKNFELFLNCADAMTNLDDLLDVIGLGFLPLTRGVALAGLVGIVFGPISNMIAIVNARESGRKLFGAKAIAYTTTAWAFNDKPLPPLPPKKNIGEARNWGGEKKALEYVNTWNMVAQKTLVKLSSPQIIKGKRLTPDAYKLLLRYLGNNDRCLLALAMWEAQKDRFKGSQDKSQFDNYMKTTIYPN